MKRILVAVLCVFMLGGLFAQPNQPDIFTLPEVYVDVTLQSQAQLQQLAAGYAEEKR